MTSTPEEREQHQDRHDDRGRAQQVEQQRGDDVADRAAALTQRAGVAGHGLRAVVGDVHDAEHAQRERQPADDLAAGRAVVHGVAQVAPGGDDQGERDEPADLADGARHGDPDRAHDVTAELEPDRRRGDQGHREDQQAHPVATVLGLELTGTAADPAGHPADPVGDREPDRGDPAEDRVEEAGDRASPGAHRARGRPALRGGAALLLRGLPRLLLGSRGGGRPAAAPGAPGAPLGRAPAPRTLTRRGRRTGRHGHQRR